MMMLGTLQMVLLAALLYCGVAGVVFSLTAPRWIAWTSTWAPESRHRALALLGITPLVLGLSALLSVMLPSLLGMLWPSQDHCLVHGGHSHLCFVHASHHVGGWSGWLLVGVAGGWLGAQLFVGTRALLRAFAIVRQLSRHARHDRARGFWIIPTDAVLCLSVGLLRPRLMVSEGLLSKAAPDELAIMLAHERAHVHRRDTLVHALVRAAGVMSTPSARRSLLRALELAAEQSCDEHAAARAGDRLCVAETILSLERHIGAAAFRSSPLIAGFGSSSVPQRVEALLQPPRENGAYARLAAACICALAIVLAAYEPLHHATESLLAVFNH